MRILKQSDIDRFSKFISNNPNYKQVSVNGITFIVHHDVKNRTIYGFEASNATASSHRDGHSLIYRTFSKGLMDEFIRSLSPYNHNFQFVIEP